MDSNLFVRGIIIGFLIAAPVGPIGVLCIRRTLTNGQIVGLISGLGAATADAVYGCIAGFGLTFISSLLISQQLWLRIVGGLFLLSLGITTFFSQPAQQVASVCGQGLLGAYVSTFLLTLTNPATIGSFALVFAGLGLSAMGNNYTAAMLLVSGVFLGSALWWLLLSGSVGLLRKRFDTDILRWVNRISGVLITGFGVAALASLLV
ncbi:MAG: lysine transporter LysE [Chloroflexi bacterium AL-W]|nr:lysine transporter LysE [Chloroflexi bacterium AL-N1]NOK65079.1 lysine transporter LysE [Chloroflexi bacterium AL-N10]NOK72654.1 lysine transporter LysE [Chloroflexi bacterium AL-N5]NOK79258.1 lysine transporter LysE [Chloroflexi bacterium AL-W]NOK87174.1 lysine transporter LysE [Chloroflexi bacterium AL-N15]